MMPPPPPPLTPGEWARERLGEVFACALLCHALRIPYLAEPAAAVDAALAELTQLASLPPAGVVPPQCAYHALLRACSHCSLPEHSRRLLKQLQASGRRPDAQTIGWLSHALIAEPGSIRSPRPEDGLEAAFDELAVADTTVDVADVTDAEAGGVVEAIGDPTEVVGSSQKLVARRSLSFSTGTFNDQRRPPASPSSGRERVAALHVHQSCEGCGGPLGAPEATAGWFARHQRDPGVRRRRDHHAEHEHQSDVR